MPMIRGLAMYDKFFHTIEADQLDYHADREAQRDAEAAYDRLLRHRRLRGRVDRDAVAEIVGERFSGEAILMALIDDAMQTRVEPGDLPEPGDLERLGAVVFGLIQE